jgi:putative aldouronate transport system substrate-binding protein
LIEPMYAHLSPTSEAGATTRVSRRAFLRGAASVALIPAASALLSACAPAAPRSATTSTAQAVRLTFPSYVPFAGPKPDFAGTADGVAPAFKTFPSQLTTSVTTPPGKGGDVTIVDIISGPPGPSLDQNVAWQQ